MSIYRRIVIIVAMRSELVQLNRYLPGFEPLDLRRFPAWRTTLDATEIVLLRCGIGMVSAAAATEFAITAWDPDAILNFGCAGAHRRDLFPGDVVIGTSAVHQGRFRFEPDGSIAQMAFDFTVPGEAATRQDIPCDPTLVAAAERAAKRITFASWPEPLRLTGQPDRPQIVSGPLASGDVWLQDPSRIDTVHLHFDSQCEDMEAAAIGQVCAVHRMPFLAIKDISNSEFHELTVFAGSSTPLPTDEVGKRAAHLLAETIRLMATM